MELRGPQVLSHVNQTVEEEVSEEGVAAQSDTVTSDWEREDKGMETRRLQRLHFNSRLPIPNFATN